MAFKNLRGRTDKKEFLKENDRSFTTTGTIIHMAKKKRRLFKDDCLCFQTS